METFPALLAICAWNSPVTGEFPAQRPVTRGFDAFFGAWINGWVSNREAGDLRRHRAHYDVSVMKDTICYLSPRTRVIVPRFSYIVCDYVCIYFPITDLKQYYRMWYTQNICA